MTWAQESVERRQEELSALREQIRRLEEQSAQQKSNEQQTLELLDTYDHKGTLLRTLIRKLRIAEVRLQRRIDTTRRAVDRLESQMAFLKDHYARYVTSIYKAGRSHDIELLFSSRSVNQFYIRNEYLQRFTNQRKRDAERILTKKRQVEEAEAHMERQLSEERRLIAEKGAEEDRLASLAADRRETLAKIRRDKSLIEQQLRRQMKAAQDMEAMIARLIEADRIRREHAEADTKLPRLPQPPAVDGQFEQKRGRLRWPVLEGSIVSRFGPQRHPTLRTVTQNTGVDIAVQSGSEVIAVAAGEVAMITWLPSYGNLVILNHANGYRTVYAHLGEIEVEKGQIVHEGETLGRSGDSLEGPRLHFEVWKERDKQNPEAWLSKP
jgi:septal ring factor EnvC (AmiA/AmiB activator)